MKFAAAQSVEPYLMQEKLPTQKFFGYFHLLFYANPSWLDITLVVVGVVAAAAAGVPFPLMGIIFGQLVDDMNGVSCRTDTVAGSSTVRPAINSKVLTLVYIAIASFFLIYVYVVAWSLVSQRLAERLRDRYFERLLYQDASFFDTRSAGEVSSRLNSDIETVQSGTSEKVGIYIASTSFFITAYIVAFTREAQLAAMLIPICPAFLLMSLLGGKYVQKFAGTTSDAIASASSIASEALSHVTVVHAFSAAPRLERKFAASMMTAQTEGIKKAIAAAVQAGLLYFIAYSANALAFWKGSQMLADTVEENRHDTTVGEMYTVVFLLIDGESAFKQ
jgi:ABC-type multidrug transport system fused ATPase/permease subunit